MICARIWDEPAGPLPMFSLGSCNCLIGRERGLCRHGAQTQQQQQQQQCRVSANQLKT